MDDGDNPFQIHSDFTNIMGSPTAGHESRKIADFEYAEGCSLYYTGTTRLQTSGIGITVTGEVDTTDLNATGIATASQFVVGVGGTDLLSEINTKTSIGLALALG